MEIERRSESPSGRTRSSSRLSNLSNQDADSDGKEPTVKRRASKRRSRNVVERENGEVDVGTEGESSRASEETPKGADAKEMNGVSESGDDKSQAEESDDRAPRETAAGDAESNKLEGSVEEEERDEEEEAAEGGKGEEEKPANGVEADNPEEVPSPVADTDEMGSGEAINDSIAVDTEESYVTAETASFPHELADSSEVSSKDLNATQEDGASEGEPGRKETENGLSDDRGNGQEENGVAEESEPRKGFLGKWSFKLGADKKEPETNGHSSSDESGNVQLYFSSIRGRPPVRRTTNAADGKPQEGSVFYRVLNTPKTLRNLDDSFNVKSEPTRSSRDDAKDRPNLRKFPGKRCLLRDESDEDDRFSASGAFTKRMKLDESESRTGFLKSFLWSPFRKRNIADVVEGKSPVTVVDEPNPKSAVSKPSWFRSPFWFWKKLGRNGQRN